jgi:hypothetical protein
MKKAEDGKVLLEAAYAAVHTKSKSPKAEYQF